MELNWSHAPSPMTKMCNIHIWKIRREHEKYAVTVSVNSEPVHMPRIDRIWLAGKNCALERKFVGLKYIAYANNYMH